MSRLQTVPPALVPLLATWWFVGCGDGTMEPTPPDPPRATTVEVMPASVTLTALGDTVRFSARVLDQNGQTMAGAAVVWSSGDATVATVDAASGLGTAVANGSATFTATSGAASGSALVAVAQIVSAVEVSPAADTLVAQGDTLRLTADAVDANGHAVAGAEFTWASGDTAVAVVDASGLVTSVGAGEAGVTATAGGLVARAQLTVLAPLPTTVAVTPDAVVLVSLGQTAQLIAEVRDQLGRVMDGVPVVWSSADSTVGVVDSDGLVSAVGSGATTITAMASEASGDALVTVMQSANSVAVSPPANTVESGDTLRLFAEAYDKNGHVMEGASFTWSSSDAEVATVDSSGLMRGTGEGTAEITAAVGDVQGTSRVTVTNPDRAALVALYHATDGPNWVKNTNWLTSTPLGQWYGVSADPFGRVYALHLSGEWDNSQYPGRFIRAGLSGTIPPELGRLSNLRHLDLSGNDLSGAIPPELGRLSNLRHLDVHGTDLFGPLPRELGALSNLELLDLGLNSLSGAIPPELGRLSNLEVLDLESNDLSGAIPPELGALSKLEVLRLAGNYLTGPMPQSFLQLGQLLTLSYVGKEAGLCVPGTSSFVAWLERIQSHDSAAGMFCNAADVAALRSLHGGAGGANWTESGGWFGDDAVDEWYGVTADSLGHVTQLDLEGNGLTGRLSAAVGLLSRLTVLEISDNALAGRLPGSLTGLPLVEFRYSETDLCAPGDGAFQSWLNAIASVQGTGVNCGRPSDREILEILYDATDGPNWTKNYHWFTDMPVRFWYGVDVDGEGRVSRLKVNRNNLTGVIPPELGGLAKLVELWLSDNNLTGSIPSRLGELTNLRHLYLGNHWTTGNNQLTGPIPPELGQLANLRWLDLDDNQLTGPIPPELGQLANLYRLSLQGNQLTGTAPPELGNMASLESLYLFANQLTGPIPAELGQLANLQWLGLGDNQLTGPVPPSLGRLTNVQWLNLNHNQLTGPVPPELGEMASLQELGLTNNTGMQGPLPADLTSLRALDVLAAGGTGLCAPTDPDFQTWLQGVHKRRIAPCAAGEEPMAYLTQAVQSREFPVPLVAGEKALLRVFPTARQATSEGIPGMLARFYVDGRETYVRGITGRSDPIPTEVDEGRLSGSVNAEIPGWVIQPGLEVVVEVDPDNTLTPELGVAKRIPGTGRMAVNVKAMPRLDLTLIPFVWTQTTDRSIVDLVRAMAADPGNHEMLWHTRTLLPIGALAVKAHEPVLSSSNRSSSLLSQTEAIRVMENGAGHYKGMMSPPVIGAGGLAYQPGRVSFSLPSPDIIAHELGHNLNLFHAPCRSTPNPDPSYPYPDGSTGAWGYDFRDGGRLVRPTTPDLMAYCQPRWISDYHFSNALRYRLFDEGTAAVAASSVSTRSLLLWGGVGADRVPYLEPAFVIDAPAALPDSAGDHMITGSDARGRELFSFSFTMPATADGDGRSSFAFALPVRAGWEGSLATITLFGSGGSVTLDGESDIPMAILRDPRTGQVRGILRDPPPETLAAADAVGARAPGTSGLEVLFSRGIPGATAWRR